MCGSLFVGVLKHALSQYSPNGAKNDAKPVPNSKGPFKGHRQQDNVQTERIYSLCVIFQMTNELNTRMNLEKRKNKTNIKPYHLQKIVILCKNS